MVATDKGYKYAKDITIKDKLVTTLGIEDIKDMEINEDVDVYENGDGYKLTGSLTNAGDTKIKNVDVRVNLNGNVYSYQASNIKTEEEEMFEIDLPNVLEDTVASISVNYEDDSKNTYVAESNCTVKALATESVSDAIENDTKESRGFWGFIKNLFGFGA